MSMLPSIDIDIRIEPAEVIKARHPVEIEMASKFDWIKSTSGYEKLIDGGKFHPCILFKISC